MLKIVSIRIKPEFVEDYVKLTELKVLGARAEKGVLSFDVFQDIDDINHFVHYEDYLDLQSEMDHKETQHYKVWKTAVEQMMAEPRSHSKLTRVY
jgi:autoinducer 2-degrading protein